MLAGETSYFHGNRPALNFAFEVHEHVCSELTNTLSWPLKITYTNIKVNFKLSIYNLPQ